MKDVVLDEVKKLSKKYCKSEKYVTLLFKICSDFEIKDIIKEVEKHIIVSVSKGVSTK